MNLLSILLNSMTSSSSVDTLSEKTGVSSAQISKLIKIALPIIITYLTKNAKSQDGASSLLGALTQHKSQKTVAEQIKNADVEDGEKIIGHILGNNKQDVVSQIANESGVDSGSVEQILGNLAPSILSGLSAATDSGAAKKKQGFDLSDGLDLTDVMALMGGSQSSGSGAADMIGSILGGSSKKENDGTELLSSLLSMMG